MNYHNRYTGGTKRKIFLRILVVFVTLTAVCVLTLAYGNYLKSKAENTKDDSFSGAGRPIDAVRNTDGDESETSFSQSESVKSACVDLNSFAESADLSDHLDKLSQNGYTGVTVVLMGRDGYLTYASDSVAEFTHQRPSAGKDRAFIREMISKARSLSMRTSAVIFTSEDFADNTISSQIEALCVADSSSFGFDEVITVLPISAEEINSEVSNEVLSYIGKLADNRGNTLLGIALDDSIFRTPSLSPQTEMFASGADFLAIDMSDSFTTVEDAESYIKTITEEISGSFTVYGLRSVFDGSVEEISEAEVRALADGGFSNYMFVSMPPLPDPDETQIADDGTTAESTPDDPTAQTS